MADGETPSPALGAGLPRLFPLEKFPPLASSKAVSTQASSPLNLGQRPFLVQDGKRLSSAPVIVDGNSTLQANNKQLNHRSFLEAALGVHESQPFHESDTSFDCQQLNPESLNPVSSYQGKPAVLFSTSEKTSLIEKLNYVLIGKFSHGRPSLVDLKAFFAGLKLVGKYSISIFDNKHVFIELELKVDYTRIWLNLAWTIKGFAMRIFKWGSDFSPTVESVVAPVWIRLEGLPLYLFDVKSLCSIANAIGKPLRVDPLNVNRIRLNSARVCVELNVALPLNDAIWIGFGEGDSMEGFWVKVFYDVLPHFCSFCNHMGHSLEQCMRKHGVVTDVLVKEKTSGPSQVWTEVKKKPNDDTVLHCKGQEFAPPVHTVEAGASLGNSSYTPLSTGAVLAAADLGNDTMAISIVERTCTSGQNKEQVTKEQIVGKISELDMKKKQEEQIRKTWISKEDDKQVDCLQSVQVTNRFAALDDSSQLPQGVKSHNGKSQQLVRVEADQQAINLENIAAISTSTFDKPNLLESSTRLANYKLQQVIPGSDLAAEPTELMDDMKQKLKHSVTSGQLEVQNRLHLQQDTSLHSSYDLLATAQDILVSNEHPQSTVQVVVQATNQGIVEVVGLDGCSAMVVREGAATAKNTKAAATYSPVATSSKQIVGVDLHLQKTPYITSSPATQKGNKEGKVSTYQIDKIAEHNDDQAQPKTAVETPPKQDDRSVSDVANTGHFVVKDKHTNYGQVSTVHNNVTETDTSPQEWQIVCQKNNKINGVVTRSQTKNAISTWAEKVEDEQIVEQSPIFTTVQAGNKAKQSRKQLERKMCNLGSRLNKMSDRHGMRSQLLAEMDALQEEYSLLR